MTVLIDAPEITAIVLKGLDSLRLPFTSEATMEDTYIVKQIDGLDPPDQNVAIAKTASGGKFQAKQAGDREIVALISLNNGNPKLLRNNLYTMLNTGYDPKVIIELYEGAILIASVPGYVTKFESALWVKDPVVQITFECLNSTFAAPELTSYAPAELSESTPSIYNSGTAETGFQFAVKFTDDMAHWFIRQAENQAIGMVFDKDFNEGDILSVSTIPGNRYVHWKKTKGTVQNKLGILRSDSEWITLHPGNNHFVLPTATDKWQWHGDLSFTARFWGV